MPCSNGRDIPPFGDHETLTRETLAVVGRALTAWALNDVEGTLDCMSDLVEGTVNAEAAEVSCLRNVCGKPQMRAKLKALVDTFECNAFIPDSVQADGAVARVGVLMYYKHRTTGERLDVRFRMVATVVDRLLVRLEEYHDAAYVAAFMRHVGPATEDE